MDKPHACPECDKTYTRKDHLKGHMRTHTGDRPYKCSECDSTFAYQHVLNNHMRSHTGERPFECTECDKNFAFRHHLDDHIRIHTGERPFKCNECNAAFAVQVNLTNHTRIHIGEKPHKCTECDAAYSTRNALKGHMRSHTGERPHKCTLCDTAFSYKHTLINHMRTHTGERPFKCTECDYSAAIESNTKDHFRRMHTLEAITRRKVEESKIEKLLNEKYPETFVREYRTDHKCLTATNNHSRVDFLFPNYGKFHVVVEVDEYQHAYYSQICETSRMNNIVASWSLSGNSMPIIFIRYNPHAFKVDGKTKRTQMAERHKKLMDLMDIIKTMEPSRDVQVYYMFYDTDEGIPVVLSDPDYYDEVKPWFAESIV